MGLSISRSFGLCEYASGRSAAERDGFASHRPPIRRHQHATRYLLAAVLAIPLALGVRVVSVAVPGIPLNLDAPHKLRAIGLFTWVGLRRCVSVALALGLPPTPERDALITACYGIVVFMMVVQGLTLSQVARKLFPEGSITPAPLNSVWRE